MSEKSPKEEAGLRTEGLKYERLRQLTDAPGWTDFQELVVAEMHKRLDDIKDSDSFDKVREARGGLRAITDLMDAVNQELNIAKHAHDKYVERYASRIPTDGGTNKSAVPVGY